MNNKTVTLTLHQDDIRRLTTANISFILGRFLSRYSNKVDDISDKIENGTKDEAIQNLQDLVNILEDACKELVTIAPLIQEFED